PRGGGAVVKGHGVLHPERTSEPSAGVVGLRTVVIQEYCAEAAIAKERAAQSPDRRRRLHPARGFGIEVTKLLQLPIFFFAQDLDADGIRHLLSAAPGLMFLP